MVEREEITEPTDGRDERRTLTAIVLCNTVTGGVMSVGLPLRLNELGLEKGHIAVFFVANAALAVLYSTALLPRLQRRGYPRAGLLAASTAMPLGLLLLSVWGGTLAWLAVGAVLMMFISTIVPMAIGIASGRTAQSVDDASVVAGIRQVLVVGFITGLGLYSILSLTPVPPLAGAVAVALVGALLVLRLPPGRLAAHTVSARRSTGPDGAALRTVTAAVALSLVAVALMKSADQLRGVYLPLYAVTIDIPEATISLLFIATAVIEIPLLSALIRLDGKFGTTATLAMVCGAGAVAFLLVFLAGNYAVLLLSQVIYAVFAAGFQSIGLVLLGRQMRGGNGAGANAYTAVTQVGIVMGVLLPLLTPGYSRWIFVIGAAICVLAAALVAAAKVVADRSAVPARAGGDR